jgi:hypothetical protein
MRNHCVKHVSTLIGLQLVLGAIAFLLSDYPWASRLVSVLFLVLIGLTLRSFATGWAWRHRWGAWMAALMVGLVWQLPGLQGSVRYLTDTLGWTTYNGVTDLQDFAMETWHTIFLPLLALVPSGQVHGYYARYYMGLIYLSPLLVLLLLTTTILLSSRRDRATA